MHKFSVAFMFILVLVASITLNVEANGLSIYSNKSAYYLGERAIVTIDHYDPFPHTVDITLYGPANGAGVVLDTKIGVVVPASIGGAPGIYRYTTPTFTAVGSYEVRVVDVAAGFDQSIFFSVEPSPPGPAFDFTILLSPASVTVEPGDVGNFKVLITYSDPSHAGTMINIQVTGLGPGMNFQLSTLGDLKITTSSTTPPGTYPITVIGSAQGKTHQTSGTIIVTTKAPSFDYSVTISPTTQTIELKEKATYTINVGLVSGAGETVALTTSGLPGDIQNSLSTASGTAPYTSTLTVDTATATSTGTFTITVTATGAGKSKTTTATLTVEEEADFSITSSPVSTEISQGDSVTFTLTMNEVGDFDQSVSLTATGLPSGASPSFSPASGKPIFTSTLTIATSESTPTGSFTLTIDASGGGKTHSTTVTLTIKEKSQETPTTAETETTETTASGSSISALLSNPTYLIVIIIAILAAALGATVLRRGRAPAPTPAPAPARPEPSAEYCLNCGARLKPGATFCRSCGQQVE